MTNIFFGRLYELTTKNNFEDISRYELEENIKIKMCANWRDKKNMKKNIDDDNVEYEEYFILIEFDKTKLTYDVLSCIKITKERKGKYRFIEMCSRLTSNEDEDNLLELINRYHDKYKTKLLPGSVLMFYNDFDEDENNINFWHGYIKHQINNKDISLKEFMINNKINQYVTTWEEIFSEEQYLT
jgi:hypothetical protein